MPTCPPPSARSWRSTRKPDLQPDALRARTWAPAGLRQRDREAVVSFGAKGRINDRWSYDASVAQQNSNQNLDIEVSDHAQAVCGRGRGASVRRRSDRLPLELSTPSTDQHHVPAWRQRHGPGLRAAEPVSATVAASAAARLHHGHATTPTSTSSRPPSTSTCAAISGDTFTLRRGPISFATGLNWRRMTADRMVDAAVRHLQEPAPACALSRRT